ncbi:FHA domain-containing protein [Wenzhouxiangella sp. XN201]|uniref:FHA domain-containing protein n=1 Tax=Wenzhouxiangella sp. XN201 TaxID=2710755 RepID=UPI0013CD25E7|nr:FHA domain-containing protein [Wenzhouxiangella sp. XN201]NEZ03692.1 FHA domain-containing protein [Wenzhouxiangella sp. XN201]
MTTTFSLQPLDETARETGPLRIAEFPCVIGRSHDCSLRLNLDRISRQHLRLQLEGEQILVEDLGSTNGTFLNNERLSAPALLKPGDTLHVADYAFRFALGEGDRPAQQRAGQPETVFGQTISGFTGDPTGFPVQAPQFYELLNEALIEPRAILARTQDGDGEALLIMAASLHPTLQADHHKLREMAAQLGEEARYHSLLRYLAAAESDELDLDHLLLLPVDPIEIEDVDILLSELEQLTNTHRRLHLACLVNAAKLDTAALQQLHESLDGIGLALAVHDHALDETDPSALGGREIIHVELPTGREALPLSQIL